MKGSSIDDVDEMLLRLYYLYEKSPKKCHQLEEIVVQVRGCILDNSIACKGKKPIRASGTRWIAHKFGAMKRILSQYGVYTNHLASLSQDSTVKSADRAKIRAIITSGLMQSTCWGALSSLTSFPVVQYYLR